MTRPFLHLMFWLAVSLPRPVAPAPAQKKVPEHTWKVTFVSPADESVLYLACERTDAATLSCYDLKDLTKAWQRMRDEKDAADEAKDEAEHSWEHGGFVL